MVDTNSINYGISKLKEVLVQVQPKIESLTTDYIKYVTWKTITEMIIWIVVCIISALIFIPVLKYGRNKGKDFTNYGEPGFIIPTVILCVFFIFSLIGSMIGIYDTITVLKFPEIFALQTLIGN